jgi:hypothetical protein
MATRYVYSGASGANDGTSWTDAYTNLAACDSNITAGDTILVASDHSHNYAAATTITIPYSCRIISVNRTSGLYEAATSNGDYTSSTLGYNFETGDGTSVVLHGIRLGSTAASGYVGWSSGHGGWTTFVRCTLNFPYFRTIGEASTIELICCTFDLNNVSATSYIISQYTETHFIIRDLTFANRNAAKTKFFSQANQAVSIIQAIITETDLSPFTTLVDTYAGYSPKINLTLERCRINS